MTAESIAQSLGKYSRQGNGFMAQCPAHDDKNPSLSIAEDQEGKILVHCKAGCSQNAVVSSLKEKGLWPNSTTPANAATDELRLAISNLISAMEAFIAVAENCFHSRLVNVAASDHCHDLLMILREARI